MKKKIVGIVVCMLLIAATVLPVVGTINVGNTKNVEKSSEFTDSLTSVSGNKCAFSGIGNNLDRSFTFTISTFSVDVFTECKLKFWTQYEIVSPDTSEIHYILDGAETVVPGPAGSQSGWTMMEVNFGLAVGVHNMEIWFEYITGPDSLSEGWYVDSIIVSGGGDCFYVEDFEEYAVGDPLGDWFTVAVESSATHTVLAEEGTHTMCGPCVYVAQYLKNIYNSGNYDFCYVALVSDKNVNAQWRELELFGGAFGRPIVAYDGGYEIIGGGAPLQSTHETAIADCENRNVKDIVIEQWVTWNGGAELGITIEVTNYGGQTYNGHLHTYVTEIVSRWNDKSGKPYNYAFIGDYPFNQGITVSPGYTNRITLVTTWDGNNYGFGNIIKDNIKVISAVFDRDNNDYVDETVCTTPFEGADIFIKDCPQDNGNIPSWDIDRNDVWSGVPPDSWYWISPWILVDNFPYNGPGVGPEDTVPAKGTISHIYAYVENIGNQDALDIEVTVYWGDFTAGTPQFPGGFNSIGSFKNFGLTPGQSKVDGYIKWNVPSVLPKHICLWAFADCNSDPVVNQGSPEWDNNIGWKNYCYSKFTPDESTEGYSASIDIQVNNPRDNTEDIIVEFFVDPYDPIFELWTFDMVFPEEVNWSQIRPFRYMLHNMVSWETQSVTLIVYAPKDTQQNTGIIPIITTFADNTPIGGCTIQVNPPDEDPPVIGLTKPIDGLYINDKKILSFPITMVIGPISVELFAYDLGSDIDRVEFILDGGIKTTDSNLPYSWFWDETVFYKHTIKVVAYDNANNYASDEIEVYIFNIKM